MSFILFIMMEKFQKNMRLHGRNTQKYKLLRKEKLRQVQDIKSYNYPHKKEEILLSKCHKLDRN